MSISCARACRIHAGTRISAIRRHPRISWQARRYLQRRAGDTRRNAHAGDARATSPRVGRLLGRLSIEVPDHDIVVGSGHETGSQRREGSAKRSMTAILTAAPRRSCERQACPSLDVTANRFGADPCSQPARATGLSRRGVERRKGESAGRRRSRSLVGARRVAGRSSAAASVPGCRGAPRSRRRTSSRTASRGRWRACSADRGLCHEACTEGLVVTVDQVDVDVEARQLVVAVAAGPAVADDREAREHVRGHPVRNCAAIRERASRGTAHRRMTSRRRTARISNPLWTSQSRTSAQDRPIGCSEG